MLVGHGWDLIQKSPRNQLANNYKRFAKNYPSRIKPKAEASDILESGVGQTTFFQPKFSLI